MSLLLFCIQQASRAEVSPPHHLCLYVCRPAKTNPAFCQLSREPVLLDHRTAELSRWLARWLSLAPRANAYISTSAALRSTSLFPSQAQQRATKLPRRKVRTRTNSKYLSAPREVSGKHTYTRRRLLPARGFLIRWFVCWLKAGAKCFVCAHVRRAERPREAERETCIRNSQETAAGPCLVVWSAWCVFATRGTKS